MRASSWKNFICCRRRARICCDVLDEGPKPRKRTGARSHGQQMILNEDSCGAGWERLAILCLEISGKENSTQRQRPLREEREKAPVRRPATTNWRAASP